MNGLHIELLTALDLVMADLLPADASDRPLPVSFTRLGEEARAVTRDDLRLAGIPVSGLYETTAFRRGP